MSGPINKLNNLQDIHNILAKNPKPVIGKLGGYNFQTPDESFKLKEVVRQTQSVVTRLTTAGKPLSKADGELLGDIYTKLNSLKDTKAIYTQQGLHKKLIRLLTTIRQLLGNIGFNKNTAIKKLGEAPGIIMPIPKKPDESPEETKIPDSVHMSEKEKDVEEFSEEKISTEETSEEVINETEEEPVVDHPLHDEENPNPVKVTALHSSDSESQPANPEKPLTLSSDSVLLKEEEEEASSIFKLKNPPVKSTDSEKSEDIIDEVEEDLIDKLNKKTKKPEGLADSGSVESSTGAADTLTSSESTKAEEDDSENEEPGVGNLTGKPQLKQNEDDMEDVSLGDTDSTPPTMEKMEEEPKGSAKRVQSSTKPAATTKTWGDWTRDFFGITRQPKK